MTRDILTASHVCACIYDNRIKLTLQRSCWRQWARLLVIDGAKKPQMLTTKEVRRMKSAQLKMYLRNKFGLSISETKSASPKHLIDTFCVSNDLMSELQNFLSANPGLCVHVLKVNIQQCLLIMSIQVCINSSGRRYFCTAANRSSVDRICGYVCIRTKHTYCQVHLTITRLYT